MKDTKWLKCITCTAVGIRCRCCLRHSGNKCCLDRKWGIGCRKDTCQKSRTSIRWQKGRWDNCWCNPCKWCWKLGCHQCKGRWDTKSCTDFGVRRLSSSWCNWLKRRSKSRMETDTADTRYCTRWNILMSKRQFDCKMWYIADTQLHRQSKSYWIYNSQSRSCCTLRTGWYCCEKCCKV